MSKIESHEIIVQNLFEYICKILKVKGLKFRPMRRAGDRVNPRTGRSVGVNTSRGYTMGRTNLKTRLITIDLYTPKFRKPKAIPSILRTLAHEITHYQKPPYRQRYRGRWITRQHYPRFYRQVKKNIEMIKKDKLIGKYFRDFKTP